MRGEYKGDPACLFTFGGHLIYLTHYPAETRRATAGPNRTWPDGRIVFRCVRRVARSGDSASRALTLHGACATVIFLQQFL